MTRVTVERKDGSMVRVHSKDPHGQGFREVQVIEDIPPLVIVNEKTSEQTILDLLQKHKDISPYQLTKKLNRGAESIYRTMKRMEDKGILTSRKVEAEVKGVRKTVIVFSLKK